MKQSSTLMPNRIWLRMTQVRCASTQAGIFVILQLLLLMLCLGAGRAEAASVYCVRPGATGANTGADWTNAYSSLPATLVRGATYYLADGSYGSYTFDDAESGSSLITIKKATAADHGVDTGWQSSYGDGQAAWTRVVFARDYYVFDGNSTSGYGMSMTPSTEEGIYIHAASSVDYITIKSVTINMNGADANTRGIQAWVATNITVSNVESHGSENDCFCMERMENSLIEKFYCHERRMGSGIHGDAFEIHSCSNITIRNSRFNWDGQQIFFGADTLGANGRWDIYGNLFYGGSSSGQGICRNSNGTGGPVYIYNNTFYGLNTTIIEGGMNYASVKNNIFIAGNDKTVGVPNMDYNYYSSDMSGYSDAHAQVGGNPFVNASAGNFKLVSATNPGLSTIGATYNTDPENILRGADGVWDRGAFEYNPAAVPVPTPVPPTPPTPPAPPKPSPPTDLKVN